MIEVSRSELRRIVVAVDPAVTVSEDSDETGIVVVGRGPHQPSTCKFEQRCPGHGYVLADYSCKMVPSGWAKRAVQAFDTFEADRIVAEVNNGGDMVGETIHAVRLGVPYSDVRATRGKLTRAEPVAALYEQGRMHHLGGFAELEDQLTTWTGEGDSPDRLDALVWAVTSLQLVGAQGAAFLAAWEEEANRIKQRVAEDKPPEPLKSVGGLSFPGYEPNKYRVRCSKDSNGRHRFFGGATDKHCVNCGCDAPVQLVV